MNIRSCSMIFTAMNQPILQPRRNIFTSWKGAFFAGTGNSPLIVFRICFGLLMFLHGYFSIVDGAVYRNFIQPPFTFTFIGFEFLQPLQGNGIYVYFISICFFALMVMLGAWYRISSFLLALMWTCVYLMQKVDYNNHYYLMVILCWMMFIAPAHKNFSVDVYRKKVQPAYQTPQWVIWMFMIQVAIMYFFAGISKLEPDWLSGKFLGIMFSRWATHPTLGHIYGNEAFRLFISYAGILFDLGIIPLLLWKKTRPYAFIMAIGFHLFNSYTFRIGIFPYLGIALCTFFFSSKTTDRLLFFIKPSSQTQQKQHLQEKFIIPHNLIMIFFCSYFILQIFLPLRHFLFPGNVYWTDEGYRMSWKMMMRTKSGNIQFKVVNNENGNQWMIDPGKELSKTHLMWLAGSPDMIWQYAQRIKNDCLHKNIENVSIYAIGQVSLNRSPSRPLIDPEADLAKISWEPFRHSYWILPFNQ